MNTNGATTETHGLEKTATKWIVQELVSLNFYMAGPE